MSQRASLVEGERAYFKSLLTDTLGQLLSENKKTPSSIIQSEFEPSDLIDQASQETDNIYAFRIRERDSRLIAKLKDALTRLENGTFGVCQECGRVISYKRLRARPIATLCIQCKEKQEYEEKIRGL